MYAFFRCFLSFLQLFGNVVIVLRNTSSLGIHTSGIRARLFERRGSLSSLRILEGFLTSSRKVSKSCRVVVLIGMSSCQVWGGRSTRYLMSIEQTKRTYFRQEDNVEGIFVRSKQHYEKEGKAIRFPSLCWRLRKMWSTSSVRKKDTSEETI